MLVARTKERESVSEDGVLWWKEYRLRPDKLRQCWCLDVRYLCRVRHKTYARVDGLLALFTDPDTIWEEWGTGSKPSEVVYEFLGDTHFLEADSCCDLHARLVKKVKEEREKNDMRYRLQTRYESAMKRLVEWKAEQDKQFRKRHGNKEGKAFQKALERTRTRLKPGLDQMNAEVKAAKAALDAFLAAE